MVPRESSLRIYYLTRLALPLIESNNLLQVQALDKVLSRPVERSYHFLDIDILEVDRVRTITVFSMTSHYHAIQPKHPAILLHQDIKTWSQLLVIHLSQIRSRHNVYHLVLLLNGALLSAFPQLKPQQSGLQIGIEAPRPGRLSFKVFPKIASALLLRTIPLKT